MPSLSINASKFKDKTLNKVHVVQIPRLKLIQFAQCVGNAHLSLSFRNRATALALSSYRAMAIRCVLDFSGKQLRAKSDYLRLEATEKANLSYWIGMTFAAVAASEVLNVHKTIHAAQRGKRIKRVNSASKIMADLIGKDTSGNWHVFEGKGRQTLPTKKISRKWKKQAKSISAVNSKSVTSNSYVVGLIDTPCAVEMVDPPSDKNDEDSIDLEVADSLFEEQYYAPYLAFLANGADTYSLDSRAVVLKPLMFDPMSGDFLFVGMEQSFFKDAKYRRTLLDQEVIEDRYYIGRNGIVICASTSPCKLDLTTPPIVPKSGDDDEFYQPELSFD